MSTKKNPTPAPEATPTEATSASQTPQSEQETPTPTPAPTEPEADESARNAEAAKYRRQLRDVEAERDALIDRVETLQREAVERLAAAELKQPAGLWAAGTQLADLLDENGNVDPAKVAEAVTRAGDVLGLAYRPRAPKPNPAQREGDAPRYGDAQRFVDAMRP